MLPVGERELAFQLGWNLELDDHRVVGERLDGLHTKRMDGRATMSCGRLRNRRGGQTLSAP